MAALTMAALFASSAAAAPIAITCNGVGLDPETGRQATAGTMIFYFVFDEQAQAMTASDVKGPPRTLQAVVVTPTLARGADASWIYEVDRIAGTAAIRSATKEASRPGLGGNYFKGNCAVRGVAKF